MIVNLTTHILNLPFVPTAFCCENIFIFKAIIDRIDENSIYLESYLHYLGAWTG
jgi:hypothetical protein